MLGQGRLATGALRALRPRAVGVVRCLSAKPPAPPSPAELEKMYQASEQLVTEIREGTYHTVQPHQVNDVPDGDTYLPANVAEMSVLTDQPKEQKSRTVYIKQKVQTAMQSAPSKSYAWTITWPSQTRWSNPLMGWTSTADPMSNQTLFFDSAEAAMRFCDRQGWSYEVSEPINRSVTLGTKKYAHNFLAESVEVKLREEGVKTKEFARPGAGASNWFMPLKYHGDGEVEQHGPKAKKK